MKKFKVIYYIGEKVDLKTKVNLGFVVVENGEAKLISKSDECVAILQNTSQVSLFMMNGLGSMLKINAEKDFIFLSVIRFCIAEQFALVNAIGTRNLKSILESCNPVA